MIRTTLSKRALALLPLALLLARPASAQTLPSCWVKETDIDLDGSMDLDIKGNTGKNTVIIDVSQTLTHVKFDCDGKGGYTGPGDVDADFGPVRTIYIKPQGNDSIFINLSGDLTGQARNVAIKLGAGTNTINIGPTPTNPYPSPGKLFASSLLQVRIDGMVGPDTVRFALPPVVDDSAIEFRAETGDANDHLYVYSTGAIQSGSMVNLKADLGGHANSLDVVQSGSISDSTFALDVQGGDGLLDLVTCSLSGQILVGGRYDLHAALGLGADRFVQKLDLANFSIASGGAVRFHVDGEDGGDTLTFTRNNTSGGLATVNDGLLDIVANGGIGGDKISVDLGGGGFVTNGTLRVRASGEAAGDTISVSADVNAASTTPNLDILLHGGSASDTLTLNLNNAGPNAAGNYGPAGAALVDGGSYTSDKCTLAGAPAPLVHKRNCEL